MTTFSAQSVQIPLKIYDWGDSAGAVKALTFFPDGKRVVTAGHDDTSTRVWDLENGTEDGERLLGCHTEPTLSVAVSKYGKEIVTGGSDGKTVVWNAETRTVSKILHAGPDGTKILCVAFNNTSSPMLVASSGSDGVVRFWKLGADEYSNPMKQLVIPNKPTVSSIAFAPGVNYIAVASYDKKVRIYEVYSGRGETPLATFDAHTLFVSSLAWFPAGQQLVSGGDKTVYVWNMRTIREQEVFPRMLVGHGKLVKTVAVTPDGRFIASGGSDGTVRLWNAVTGVQIGSPLSIGYPAFAGVDIVAFSPDGKVLLSIDKNGGYLWDMNYLEVEEGIQGMRRVIDDLVISSAEQQLEMQEIFKDEMDKMCQTYEQQLADLRHELGQVRIVEEERLNLFQAAHDTAMKTQEEAFRSLHKALHDEMHAQESRFGRERAAWEAQIHALRSDVQALVQTQEKGLNLLEDVEKTQKRGLKELHGAQKKAEETQEQQYKDLKKGLQELVALTKKPPTNVVPGPAANRFGSN